MDSIKLERDRSKVAHTLESIKEDHLRETTDQFRQVLLDGLKEKYALMEEELKSQTTEYDNLADCKQRQDPIQAKNGPLCDELGIQGRVYGGHQEGPGGLQTRAGLRKHICRQGPSLTRQALSGALSILMN